MHSEVKTIGIHKELTDKGYITQSMGDTWSIWEPQHRKMPQHASGLRTIEECEAWAEGMEAIEKLFSPQDVPA